MQGGFCQISDQKDPFKTHLHADSRMALKVMKGDPAHQGHICIMAFHEASTLMEHVYKHTGEKPFKCLVCSRKLQQQRVPMLRIWIME